MALELEGPVSPELALVDPILREQLIRESLETTPEHLDTSARPAKAQLAVATEPAREWLRPPNTAPHQKAPRSPRSRRSIVGTAVLAALLLAVPSLAFLPPRHSPTIGTDIGAAQVSGNAPKVTPSRITIAWQSDRAADYYVFEVLREMRVVGSRRTIRPTVTWMTSLLPGSYSWRVFVGLGPVEQHKLRGPIASGRITIAR